MENLFIWVKLVNNLSLIQNFLNAVRYKGLKRGGHYLQDSSFDYLDTRHPSRLCYTLFFWKIPYKIIDIFIQGLVSIIFKY